MKQHHRYIIYFLILTTTAIWIIFTNPNKNAHQRISAPQVGFRAPDFTLHTLDDGGSFTLSELKGQAVLVNLWATWCPPCRVEMPAIEKMYKEYKNQGLVVLAINMTYQDKPESILPFTKEYGLTFPILLDINGVVSNSYKIHSLPSSYFINRAGIINKVVIGGPMAEALLRTRIEEILK
jgi:peroxiredoxin